MYVGIDLGTSNSAIVGSQPTGMRLFKAEDGRDVLPSVIHYTRNGNMTVGARAYAQAELAPGNVAQGFKRLMGTSSIIDLPGANRQLSPEDASAEVIRALLRQARSEAGEVEVTGAIITIPAAFNQMQSEATIRSAQSAGLEHVGLLQEPVAAAMAALAGTDRKDGRFLVYDLGGGTFDVALVEAVAGAVTVIAHDGVNMLGGRDFDRAIVDSVIRPWLLEHFSLPADMTRRPEYKRLLAMARYHADTAKIQLTTREEAQIYVDQEDIRAEDLNGNPLYIECTLTRQQLNAMVRERIDESVALCRKLLASNGLTHEDIDRVVLIGGPSKMPIVREMITHELGIALDHTTDPMTAVAFGAAIFAESRDWSNARGSRKRVRSTTVASGTIELKLRYLARVSAGQTSIRLDAGEIGDGYQFRIMGPQGYVLGFAPFSGSENVSVSLPAMGDNPFTVEVTGADGSSACPKQTFVITRTEASVTAIPATQTVAVKVASGPIAERRNVLSPLVSKGAPLPAHGVTEFRLREALTCDDGSRLDIEVYNQTEGIDDPLLNLPVGIFRIIGRDLLDAGQHLPAGAAVNIHWKMDDNGLITCEVELPDLGMFIREKNFYVSSATQDNFAGQDGEDLAKAQIAGAGRALEQAGAALAGRSQSELALLERRLARMEDLLANSDDAEARKTVCQEALYIQQELARLRDAKGNRRTVLMNELSAFEDGACELIDTLDADAVVRMQALGSNARQAIAAENWSTARQILDQMHGDLHRALYRQPAFILQVFEEVAAERYAAVDKALHDRHVARGRSAAEAGRFDEVREVIGDILGNRMPGGGASAKATLLAGLTK